MSAGSKAFRKIQVGLETTRGQSVPATARLIGTLTPKQTQKYYRPSDLETGALNDYTRSDITSTQMTAAFESDANYEQLAYLLGMAVKGGITPTGGSSAPYIWTYLLSPTASQTLDTRTVEYGDDVQAFQSPFVFGTDIELTGKLEDVVKVKSNLVGQFLSTHTFTTALTNPTTLHAVNVGTGKTYLDPTWAGLGGTQLSSTLVDFSYKLTSDKGTPQTPIKYMDGNNYYTDIAEQKRHIEMSLTLAFNSSVTALFADYTASPQTAKFWDLKFTGPTITGGTMGLALGGCFIIDDYSELKDRDGQDIVSLKLMSRLDATSGDEYQIILTNSIASLV
jgi:hypothetical protein